MGKTAVARHDVVMRCLLALKNKKQAHLLPTHHSSNRVEMLALALLLALASPVEEAVEGEAPVLSGGVVALLDAAVLELEEVRFIFKICNMSASERVFAFSLKRFAFAWLFFKDLMTWRRSLRMRAASPRNSRIRSSQLATLVRSCSSGTCVREGSPSGSAPTDARSVTLLSLTPGLASMSGMAVQGWRKTRLSPREQRLLSEHAMVEASGVQSFLPCVTHNTSGWAVSVG